MGNGAPVNFKAEAKVSVDNFTQLQIDTYRVGATEQLVFMPVHIVCPSFNYRLSCSIKLTKISLFSPRSRSIPNIEHTALAKTDALSTPHIPTLPEQAYNSKQDANSHLQETGSDVGRDPTASATAVTTNEMKVLRATLDSLPATVPISRVKSHQAYSKLSRLGDQIMQSWCESNTILCTKQRQQASGPP